MFEEMASDAVKMLIVLFWITIASIIIWGALWVRSIKDSKQD
jgi:heme/copper-type cytochrome/quinol oxidase subunit 4